MLALMLVVAVVAVGLAVVAAFERSRVTTFVDTNATRQPVRDLASSTRGGAQTARQALPGESVEFRARVRQGAKVRDEFGDLAGDRPGGYVEGPAPEEGTKTSLKSLP